MDLAVDAPLIFLGVQLLSLFVAMTLVARRQYWLGVVGMALQVTTMWLAFVARNHNSFADSSTYQQHFRRLASFSEVVKIHHRDYASNLLMWLTQQLDERFAFFLATQAAIVIALIALAYRRMLSERVWLASFAVFLLGCTSAFYLVTGNILRQGLAIAVFTYALTWRSKKWQVALLLMGLAGFFHKSAFLMGAMFFALALLPSRGIFVALTIAVAAILGLMGIDNILIAMGVPWLSMKLSQVRGLANDYLPIKTAIVCCLLAMSYWNFARSRELVDKWALCVVWSVVLLALSFYSADKFVARYIYYADILAPVVLCRTAQLWRRDSVADLSLVATAAVGYLVVVLSHPSILRQLEITWSLF